MERDCGRAAVSVAKLLVRPLLTDLNKTQSKQRRHDFARLTPAVAASGNDKRLRSHKPGLERRHAIVRQHLDDFAQICIEFIERCALRMRTREARDVAHVKAGIGTLFDHCGEGMQCLLRVSLAGRKFYPGRACAQEPYFFAFAAASSARCFSLSKARRLKLSPDPAATLRTISQVSL